MATFALMTNTRRENIIVLYRMLCIYYLVVFPKRDKKVTKTLINFTREINAMTLAYTKELGLQTQQTMIGAQKIDDSSLKTFKIVIASF